MSAMIALPLLLLLSPLLCTSFTPAIHNFLSTTRRNTGPVALKQFEDIDSQDDVESNIDMSEADLLRPILYRPEDDMDCVPPGHIPKTRTIFLISDATGVTARSTLLKSLAQFDTCADDAPIRPDDPTDGLLGGVCDVQMRTFTFIRSFEALSIILKTAKEKEACVMFTLADPALRNLASEICASETIPHTDLMGPSLTVLADFLQREPLGIPARLSGGVKRRALGDSYYQRIDAVEFCLKADDGQSPWLLAEADIVIVGVSRSGKTPLSVVLSQSMGLKVANIPLVVGIPPPMQLLELVDPRRIFCLTISPSQLRRIRTSRLERRNVKAIEEKYDVNEERQSTYNDRAYLLKDLKNARELSQRHNWTEIDVTGRAVEETGAIIVELFNERFEEAQFSPNSLR
jgi:regulator of PEP synthase PpsR (kinase-PPPase family)